MDKFNVIKISSVDSTNQHVLSLRSDRVFKEGLAFIAKYQHKGRGQRGNLWESERGKNLLVSLLIEPNVLLSDQFIISKIACLSVIDCLLSLGVEAKIKWPNDILIQKKKIAGILVDNVVSKGMITHSVIGIGINVNQFFFDDYSPNATSLKLELDKFFDLEEIQNLLLQSIQRRVISFRLGEDLDVDYLDLLYQKDKVALFQAKSERFYGIIRGVNERGGVMIEIEDNIRNFDLKEIRMLF